MLKRLYKLFIIKGYKPLKRQNVGWKQLSGIRLRRGFHPNRGGGTPKEMVWVDFGLPLLPQPLCRWKPALEAVPCPLTRWGTLCSVSEALCSSQLCLTAFARHLGYFIFFSSHSHGKISRHVSGSKVSIESGCDTFQGHQPWISQFLTYRAQLP